MIYWRIYYDGETPKGYSTYSNEDGSWEKAYHHGVICIVVRDNLNLWGRFIISGYSPKTKERGDPDSLLPVEIFVKYPDDEEPFATNSIFPFKNKMLAKFEVQDITPYIKYGRQASQEEWQRIMKLAAEDKDFPKGTPRRRKTDGV